MCPAVSAGALAAMGVVVVVDVDFEAIAFRPHDDLVIVVVSGNGGPAPFNGWRTLSSARVRYAPLDVDFGIVTRGVDVDVRLALCLALPGRWWRGWRPHLYDPFSFVSESV